MKKADKKLLDEALSKALAPPKRRRDLNAILDEYDDDKGSAHPGSAHPTPAQPAPPQTTSAHPVAPARDFNRRPNSIERDALPAGLFPGASKKLYDALYLRTRGAVVPARTVRATRSELMRWARIGSRNTFHSHMRHLTGAGLVIRHFEAGDNEGAVYEVCIPEEIAAGSAQPTSAHLGSPQPDPAQKVGLGSAQKVGRGEVGQPTDFQRTSGEDKTSFKTNTEKTDDELAPLRALERELTGKNSSWEEVVAILVTELKIAAGRTTVSSVPAFLAEHLRRRLWKKDKRQLDAERGVEVNSGQVGAITGDISKCPECFGTGMRYRGPGQFEGPVERCPHSRLSHG